MYKSERTNILEEIEDLNKRKKKCTFKKCRWSN